MRILHTLANWKWTGPAEPAVRLAAELKGSHEVAFACGTCPYADLENEVARAAERAGLALLPGLRLSKHFAPASAARDFLALSRLLRQGRFDLVHAHLLNDHLLAGAAARRALPACLIVRTVYGVADAGRGLRARFACARLLDGAIASSQAAADALRAAHALPEERVFVVPGAVDTARFSPERLAGLRAAARAELRLDGDVVAGGIVARIQHQRRFDLLFQAFAAAAAREARLRLVVIGRGTHAAELAQAPVQRLGIAGRVHFAGYRAGEAYDAALAALDFGVFLVPGSDGSCRAARELAAASLPVVATTRPPLPEIVEHGATGFVLPEEPERFAAAFVELARDAGARARLGAAARERACRLFSLPRQAEQVDRAYEALARLGPRRRA